MLTSEPIIPIMIKSALILTCEHGVNTIPAQFTQLFAEDKAILDTHRGIDIGAKVIADHLAKHLPCIFYHAATVSRLLIDCNRKLNNKHCFSEWSRDLSSEEKQHIIDMYYRPFRESVINAIGTLIHQKKHVLHLSIHSFTPVLYEKVRTAEIGLLYDPKRTLEKDTAATLKRALETLTPHYRIRLNYPYLGTSDGFTTFLRQQFAAKTYIGLEIETNQALMTSEHTQQALIKQLTTAIATLDF